MDHCWDLHSCWPVNNSSSVLPSYHLLASWNGGGVSRLTPSRSPSQPPGSIVYLRYLWPSSQRQGIKLIGFLTNTEAQPSCQSQKGWRIGSTHQEPHNKPAPQTCREGNKSTALCELLRFSCIHKSFRTAIRPGVPPLETVDLAQPLQIIALSPLSSFSSSPRPLPSGTLTNFSLGLR